GLLGRFPGLVGVAVGKTVVPDTLVAVLGGAAGGVWEVIPPYALERGLSRLGAAENSLRIRPGRWRGVCLERDQQGNGEHWRQSTRKAAPSSGAAFLGLSPSGRRPGRAGLQPGTRIPGSTRTARRCLCPAG